MKTCAIAIFVKTPGVSPVKTRLQSETSEWFSTEFYRRCIGIARAVVKDAVDLYPGVTPCWAVAENTALYHPMWTSFQRISQGSGTLGRRMSVVYNQLVEQYGAAILIGADLPLLTADHIEEALDHIRHHIVIGPAIDGGFYLIGGSCAIPERVWTGVPYSAPDTRNRLVRRLKEIKEVHFLPEISDADTLNDLFGIVSQSKTMKKMLGCQEQLIQWIQGDSGILRSRPHGGVANK